MVAFIENTPAGWSNAPVRKGTAVEVERES